ncbi:hypothetical protein ASG92_25570 [Arthrobacter sp. Soil736]|uniref:YegP family protein n=1 Tax=Arthrobacter sp. Soil736 TaxID=1736395 RepID=UPI0006F8136D|nr:DUF1508 domain-containing protein [Arthrobacter sp. Soil736]KRE52416.1 hypothetical protein ASG92_25570 [Arthrobacter sp. Soil736]
MTGTFELFIDEDTSFRFRLKAPDGTVVAVSRSFPDKPAAVSGISDVREYAGMGLIADLCPEVPVHGSSPALPAPGARQGLRSSTDRRTEGPKPTTVAPQRTTATGSYRPAAPLRVRVGSELHKVA